jgi:hypothetical protein
MGNLKDIGSGQHRKGRGYPAGEARGDEKAADESRGGPHPEAAGANEEFANGAADTVAPSGFVNFARPGVALKPSERGAQSAGHTTTGEEPAELLSCHGQQEQVASAHLPRQVATRGVQPETKTGGEAGERTGQNSVSTEWPLLVGAVARERSKVLNGSL